MTSRGLHGDRLKKIHSAARRRQNNVYLLAFLASVIAKSVKPVSQFGKRSTEWQNASASNSRSNYLTPRELTTQSS